MRERAQRIYEKYGNVMLETEGMTKAGIERKATCRALFSKLLYLAGEQIRPWADRALLHQRIGISITGRTCWCCCNMLTA